MTDYPVIKNGEDLAKFFDDMPLADPNAEHGFDMQFDTPSKNTSHPCGSAMGIGGWVAFLRPDLEDDNNIIMSTALLLGVNYRHATKLCFHDKAIEASRTPQQAAQAIRNTMELNDPKWELILDLKFGEYARAAAARLA